jgi:hypothetical protein
MTTRVTRLYATPEKAEAAASALAARGFGRDIVSVLHMPAGTDMAKVTGALRAAGLVKAAVEGYAPHLRAGHPLVIATAPTGAFFKVRDILEEYGPLASGVARQDVHVSDEAIFRAEVKPFTLMTGRRFGGNNFLLLTGTYWGGPQRKLLTGTYWGGPQRKLLTGTYWGGPQRKLLTGTRWGGFWPRLLTGTFWGGPVPRIIRKERYVPAP